MSAPVDDLARLRAALIDGRQYSWTAADVLRAARFDARDLLDVVRAYDRVVAERDAAHAALRVARHTLTVSDGAWVTDRPDLLGYHVRRQLDHAADLAAIDAVLEPTPTGADA